MNFEPRRFRGAKRGLVRTDFARHGHLKLIWAFCRCYLPFVMNTKVVWTTFSRQKIGSRNYWKWLILVRTRTNYKYLNDFVEQFSFFLHVLIVSFWLIMVFSINNPVSVYKLYFNVIYWYKSQSLTRQLVDVELRTEVCAPVLLLLLFSCSCRSALLFAVSYTHLTLPTNREV